MIPKNWFQRKAKEIVSEKVQPGDEPKQGSRDPVEEAAKVLVEARNKKIHACIEEVNAVLKTHGFTID